MARGRGRDAGVVVEDRAPPEKKPSGQLRQTSRQPSMPRTRGRDADVVVGDHARPTKKRKMVDAAHQPEAQREQEAAARPSRPNDMKRKREASPENFYPLSWPADVYKCRFAVESEVTKIFYVRGFRRVENPRRADRHTLAFNDISQRWEYIPYGMAPGQFHTKEDAERWDREIGMYNLQGY